MIATIRRGITAANKELGLAERFQVGSKSRIYHLEQAIKEFESAETRIPICIHWIKDTITHEQNQ